MTDRPFDQARSEAFAGRSEEQGLGLTNAVMGRNSGRVLISLAAIQTAVLPVLAIGTTPTSSAGVG